MVGGIISQLNRNLLSVDPIYQPMHELGPTGMILRTIIGINHPVCNQREAVFHFLPPKCQQIHQAICGDFRGDKEQIKFISIEEEKSPQGLGLPRA